VVVDTIGVLNRGVGGTLLVASCAGETGATSEISRPLTIVPPCCPSAFELTRDLVVEWVCVVVEGLPEGDVELPGFGFVPLEGGGLVLPEFPPVPDVGFVFVVGGGL
jgi:hypothetical protein